MIKILDSKNSNYLSKLKLILEKRKLGSKINTDNVIKIVKDIKKNKRKALIKYEKKFSKNTKIKTTINEINNSIKSLDPKIKAAIHFLKHHGDRVIITSIPRIKDALNGNAGTEIRNEA